MNEVAPIDGHPALPLLRLSLLELGYHLCSAFVSNFDIRLSDFFLFRLQFDDHVTGNISLEPGEHPCERAGQDAAHEMVQRDFPAFDLDAQILSGRLAVLGRGASRDDLPRQVAACRVAAGAAVKPLEEEPALERRACDLLGRLKQGFAASRAPTDPMARP
jgi:hypothetical protein